MKPWRPLISTGLLLILLLTPPAVHACEPCIEILGLEDTATQAELIIIGQKVAEAPHTSEHNGPDWITVRVVEILKGQIEQGQIQVNSWDGMCAYGIVADEGESYVMFLEQRNGQYDAVNIGCAVTALPVKDDAVETEEQVISIDDLVAKLGPGASRVKVSYEATEEGDPVQTGNILPVWVGVFILVVIALLSLRIKSKRPLT